jgi:hypothetical protein
MQTQLFLMSNFTQEQKPNKIMRSSPYEELYGTVPHVNAAHISPFTASTEAQLGRQSVMNASDVPFLRNYAPYTGSSAREATRQPEFICRHCNRKFYKPHAYGGHMRSHNITKKKILHGQGRA